MPFGFHDNLEHVKRNEREMMERAKDRSAGGGTANLFCRPNGTYYIGSRQDDKDRVVAQYIEGKRIL